VPYATCEDHATALYKTQNAGVEVNGFSRAVNAQIGTNTGIVMRNWINQDFAFLLRELWKVERVVESEGVVEGEGVVESFWRSFGDRIVDVCCRT